MKRLVSILIIGLVTDCSHKYSHTGTIADAERAVAKALLVPEDRMNWIRYRLVRDVSGLWITTGAATIRVDASYAVLSGSGEVRG